MGKLSLYCASSQYHFNVTTSTIAKLHKVAVQIIGSGEQDV